MDQGNYRKEKKQESITDQGRYGMNNSSAEPELWTCPNCETVNTACQCGICGLEKPGSENIKDIRLLLQNTKRGCMVITVAIVTVLVFVIGFALMREPAVEKTTAIGDETIIPKEETTETAVTIKTTRGFAGTKAILVFHQDENECIVRIDSYAEDKTKLEMYYTLAYEDNKIAEICRFTPAGEELAKHIFIYKDGTVFEERLTIQRGHGVVGVSKRNTRVTGYKVEKQVFEETEYSWDSFIFHIQRGKENPVLDIKVNRSGLIEGYAVWKGQESEFYSEELQLISEKEYYRKQNIVGDIDVEYNTDEKLKPRYIFRDESGQEIHPASFDTIIEYDDGYSMRLAKISNEKLYIAMRRDADLFGKSKKFSATIQFYYIAQDEPSEKIRLNVGNRDDDRILEMVVDMSQAENWVLEEVETIRLYLRGPNSSLELVRPMRNNDAE